MNLRLYIHPLFTISLSVFLTSVPGFCDEGIDDQLSKLESDVAKIRTKTAFGNYGARTASATPQFDGYGVVLKADFLWWKLYEGGTEYAFKDEIDPFSITQLKGPIKHLNFEWEPGYKVGLGYLFDHDSWETQLDFTAFETHAHSSTSSSTDGLLPLIGVGTINFSKAKAKWHVNFYDIDFVLGRNYFVSKYLALNPYFGLTSAWIQQHRKAHYVGQSEFKLHGKNNFWGIGPRLGLGSQFFLGRNFSLYGDVVGSLLWGNFHIKETEQLLTTGNEFYDLKYSLHRMVATVGFSLGLSYETNFNHDSNHFIFKVGYEGQYWWRQNQFPQIDPSAFDFTRKSEDLSMQGLTAEIRLGF